MTAYIHSSVSKALCCHQLYKNTTIKRAFSLLVTCTKCTSYIHVGNTKGVSVPPCPLLH